MDPKVLMVVKAAIKQIVNSAFTPGAIVNGKKNPEDELAKCRFRLTDIDDIISKI